MFIPDFHPPQHSQNTERGPRDWRAAQGGLWCPRAAGELPVPPPSPCLPPAVPGKVLVSSSPRGCGCVSRQARSGLWCQTAVPGLGNENKQLGPSCTWHRGNGGTGPWIWDKPRSQLITNLELMVLLTPLSIKGLSLLCALLSFPFPALSHSLGRAQH